MHKSYKFSITMHRNCVIYGVESWSGVLECSHGVGFWSGLWGGMESDFVSPFSDRILRLTDRQ